MLNAYDSIHMVKYAYICMFKIEMFMVVILFNCFQCLFNYWSMKKPLQFVTIRVCKNTNNSFDKLIISWLSNNYRWAILIIHQYVTLLNNFDILALTNDHQFRVRFLYINCARILPNQTVATDFNCKWKINMVVFVILTYRIWKNLLLQFYN